MGRFLSSFLGPDVAVHIEYCNQALEQSIAGSATEYSFGVVLGDTNVFRANGRQFTPDDVMVLPPGGILHMHSPMDGAVMAIVINCDRLLGEAGLSPHVADWLEEMRGDIALLRAPRLARRLREDARLALEGASVKNSNPDALGTIIGNALVASLTAKLSLECTAPGQGGTSMNSNSYARFLECRAHIHEEWERIHQISDLTDIANASKRSLQNAFSIQLSVGPLAYSRIFRLHLARHALLGSDCSSQSIGDIAAAYGFWNWSRFSNLYSKQFGELPSRTRERL